MAAQSPYDPAKYGDGTRVRISSRTMLDEFRRSWKWHNKLEPEQLEYAGSIAKVEKSYMYHGGDILYKLEDIPGLWHEQCLEPV